jgi:hypothetical protein
MLSLILSLILNLSQAQVLIAGNYIVASGNNESICPQKVRPIFQDGQLNTLQIVYVGDCFYWGPFDYSCVGNQCGDSNIMFEITSATSYNWHNFNWDIHGMFVLSR